MAEETKTLYVRIALEQSDRLDAWIERQNATLARAMGPYHQKLTLQAGVRMLLDEGMKALDARAAAAAAEAKAELEREARKGKGRNR